MSTTVRVNNKIKEEVTPILDTLGISLGEAINMFLHQIKLHNGIPFDLVVRASPLEFWADVKQTRDDVATGEAPVYKTTDDFMEALRSL